MIQQQPLTINFDYLRPPTAVLASIKHESNSSSVKFDRGLHQEEQAIQKSKKNMEQRALR